MPAWLGALIAVTSLPFLLALALLVEAIFESSPRHFYQREQAARREDRERPGA